jgi:adenine-specific DNA-methyltransferase
MPTLQFKGKNIIWNHHLSVPYHALDDVSKLSYKPEKANGNLIIEGDNLLALKALLPLYTGQIKCIYIDPPYNTGNEGWIYNDNVNSPLLKDWFGKEVGKDDLTRHDKWLCMMAPRLKLLRELLADDGIIYVSIDDNEFDNLIILCDEIFMPENRFGIMVVENNPRGRRLGTELAVEHEYLVVYAKNINKFNAGRLPLTEEQLAEYNHWDETVKKKYRLLGLRKRGALSKQSDRPNLHFPLYVNTKDYSISLEKQKGYVEVIPKLSDGTNGVWRWSKTKIKEDYHFLVGVLVTRRETGEKEWDVFEMDYLDPDDEKTGRLFPTIWDGSEFNNETGRDQIKDLFGKAAFNYPKPVDLIRHLLILSNDKNCWVLDSFAGSGTTGQAVLEQNNADGGNRKFILVQMTEAIPDDPKKNICKDITRERAKLTIEKFEYDSGFEYMRVGQAMDAEALLSGKLPDVEQFGSYVFYLCTGEKTRKPVKKVEKNLYLVGAQGNVEIYLLYSQDYDELTRLALNLDVAEKIATSNQKRYVVYSPACFLDEDYLRAKQIEFVNIPYGLFQRKGNEA